MGQVQSGSGNQYTMNCLGKGSLSVTIPQIDQTYTVPVGTWGVVIGVADQDGNMQYYFQPPVWLA